MPGWEFLAVVVVGRGGVLETCSPIEHPPLWVLHVEV